MNEKAENDPQGALFPPGRRIGTKSEYARHRGCAPSAVTRALAEGRISTITIRGKERIDFDAADAAWSVSTRPRIDAHPPPPRGARDDRTERARDELRDLRIQRERITLERAALDLDERAGLLVELAEVDYVLDDCGSRWRSTLSGVADRLAPEVFGLADLAAVHSRIETMMMQILSDFCAGITRARSDLDAHHHAGPEAGNSNA